MKFAFIILALVFIRCEGNSNSSSTKKLISDSTKISKNQPTSLAGNLLHVYPLEKKGDTTASTNTNRSRKVLVDSTPNDRIIKIGSYLICAARSMRYDIINRYHPKAKIASKVENSVKLTTTHRIKLTT